MSSYTLGSALRTLGSNVTVKGKLIFITGNLGLKKLGALDYLKNNHNFKVMTQQ